MLKTALIAAGMLITAGTAAYATTGTTPVKNHRAQQIVIPGGPWTPTPNGTQTAYVDTTPCAGIDAYITWTGNTPNVTIENLLAGQDYGGMALGGPNTSTNTQGRWTSYNHDQPGPQTAIVFYGTGYTITSAVLNCRPYS